jgi:NAD(P)-dependent dehydrogenase (short-subunit alcohol dehydrogenase family)
MKKALLIGANGTIGSALADAMRPKYELYTLSREETDYSENSLENIAKELKEQGKFSLIICCVGTLHNDNVAPEKRLGQLNEASLSEYFRINTIIPALCLRFFQPLLDKTEPSQFTFLSAMVGSIGDNSLGGWYGYRSSKAALNMMVKTASIEIKRSNKMATIAAIHPGTTIGPLSKPFASGVSKDKYYTPEQSAERILTLSESLTAEQTGAFFNWDGTHLPW